MSRSNNYRSNNYESNNFRSNNAHTVHDSNAGIDVLSCVQGNTARVLNASDRYDDNCVVYDFDTEASARDPYFHGSADRAALKKRRARNRRKKAARARKVMAIRACMLAAVFALILLAGGIASKAQSRKGPEMYKYYDTITVAYQENLLDIVLRYDNRDHYDTQLDYVRELCRINNIDFDGTSYPEVAPGTHLVVPYYSAVLK